MIPIGRTKINVDFQNGMMNLLNQKYYKSCLHYVWNMTGEYELHIFKLQQQLAAVKGKLKEAEEEKNRLEEKFKWLKHRIMGDSD